MRINKKIRSSFNKKHIFIILFSLIIGLSVGVLFSDNIYYLGKNKNYIDKVNCNYSIIINKDIGKDTYAYYDREIVLSKYDDLKESLNAIVLMETANVHSENDYYFTYELSKLKEFEVAISENLADKNNIKIGSNLFSINRYNNEVCTYVVKIIIPSFFGFNENDLNTNKGVILLGKSEEYLKNIKTNYIYFYDTDFSLINQKNAKISGELNSFLKLKNNITLNYMLYLCIVAMTMSFTSILAFVILLYFNRNIYIKKKQFGVKKLNGYIFTDICLYTVLYLVMIDFIYILFSFFMKFVIEIFILNNFIILMISFFSYVFQKNYIKRR